MKYQNNIIALLLQCIRVAVVTAFILNAVVTVYFPLHPNGGVDFLSSNDSI